MEHAIIPHERDRLNDEIEKAYSDTVAAMMDIRLFNQTGRGSAVLDLYENFFWNFGSLVTHTKNESRVEEKGLEILKRAIRWSDTKVAIDSDTAIMKALTDGISVFEEFAKVLWSTGVISLPSG